ncbi:MAG: hypothetical protein HFI09_05120 [Bacilli bacterium]|nr:hypothetical protein [Bacilli bacterium]
MIEFIEEGHLYLKDGIIIPSVSEILHFIFPDKYKGIDRQILNKKAEYGSKIHESIEMLEENIKVMNLEEAIYVTIQSQQLKSISVFSLKQYIRLKEKNKIQVLEQEQIINYKDDYAGRFDMITRVNEEFCLCDIKTTAVLDKEYLSWQLSFYELAHMTMYGTVRFEKLYAIWLPKKGYGELVEIERKSINELLKVLKEFKESRKEVTE